MLKTSTRISLLTTTTIIALVCLVIESGAVPIEAASGAEAHLSNQRRSLDQVAGTGAPKKEQRAVYKHAKPVCQGAICNHADFYD